MQHILYTAAAPTGKGKITVNNRKQERGGAFQPSAYEHTACNQENVLQQKLGLCFINHGTYHSV
jgi:hypothetical protein